jgi:hypothetical protein
MLSSGILKPMEGAKTLSLTRTVALLPEIGCHSVAFLPCKCAVHKCNKNHSLLQCTCCDMPSVGCHACHLTTRTPSAQSDSTCGFPSQHCRVGLCSFSWHTAPWLGNCQFASRDDADKWIWSNFIQTQPPVSNNSANACRPTDTGQVRHLYHQLVRVSQILCHGQRDAHATEGPCCGLASPAERSMRYNCGHNDDRSGAAGAARCGESGGAGVSRITLVENACAEAKTLLHQVEAMEVRADRPACRSHR